MVSFTRSLARTSALVLVSAVCVLTVPGNTTTAKGTGSVAKLRASKVLDTVSLAINGPVTSLDPAKGSSFQDIIAATALYDPLVVFNEQGKIIPGLATSWKTTPKSATFKLRTDVTCSDGTKMTPSVVAASLRRYMSPSTGAPLLTTVIGSGNSATASSNNAKHTVTVSLKHPWSQLLAGMTSGFTGIVCPAGLKHPANLLTHSDGTGAYVASSEISGATYTFKRRSGYHWGPKYPNQPKGSVPKTLVLKVVSDDNTASNLMATNSLNIAPYTTNNWTRFQGKSGYRVVTEPQSDTMLVFNETPGHATAQQSIRKAITQVLNRQGMTNVLGNGRGITESNLGQSSYQCFDPSLNSLIPSYNPSAASRVLRGLRLRLIGTTLVAGGNGTSYLLAELNQAGARATLRNMNNEAWVTELFSGKNDWDLTILVYGNTLNTLLSAGNFFTGVAPPKGENLGNVQNAAAAAAFAKAGALVGPAGCAATSRFQRLLLARDDFVPLTAAPVTVVFAGGTAGYVVKGFVHPSSIRVTG